jgi:hypothetical protein
MNSMHKQNVLVSELPDSRGRYSRESHIQGQNNRKDISTSVQSLSSQNLTIHKRILSSDRDDDNQKSFNGKHVSAASFDSGHRTLMSPSDNLYHLGGQDQVLIKTGLDSPSLTKEEPHGPLKCVEDSPPEIYMNRSRSSLSSYCSMRLAPECSFTRSETKETIKRVQESIRTASKRLGSSHAIVERARKELQRLQLEERKSRQEEVVQFHGAIIEAAVRAGDLDGLEAATQAAV